MTSIPTKAATRLEAGTTAFELVGTMISPSGAMAFVKEPDQTLVTLRQGDKVDGYTIAAITPDGVRLRSSDNDERFLTLREGGVNGTASGARPNGETGEPAPKVGLITEGINIDQSIPEHITWGPTGRLPEGVKQIGH